MSHANAPPQRPWSSFVGGPGPPQGWAVAHAAKAMGISRQCAHRWVARFDAEGEAGLADRSSRPTPARPDAAQRWRPRSWRPGSRIGAGRTGSDPSSACQPAPSAGPAPPPGAVPARAGPAHRRADPLLARPPRSATNATGPGSWSTWTSRRSARIPDGGGWRAHGRAMGSTAAQKKARIGYDYVHSLVDDHSRLAYSEILPDEKGATCAGFIAPRRRLLRRPRHHPHRTGHHRQPLQLPPQHRRRSRDRRRSAPRTSSSGRTAPGRTARSNGSTAPWPPSGPTGRSSPATTTRRRPCPLAGALQHSTTPHRPRRPPADQPPVTNLTEYT